MTQKIKRMGIKKMEVKCDADGCSWRREIQPGELMLWHNEPCPACGRAPIISDNDVRAFVNLKLLMALDEVIDPEGKLPRKDMHIDTADLRRDSRRDAGTEERRGDAVTRGNNRATW